MMFGVEIFAIVGFVLAAYATVANDSIQTLGTFLSSNAHRHWIILWAYASSIIIAVMAFGYFANAGDIGFDRLDSLPYPETSGMQWWHAMPPLVLLFLTRFGIPVSTTFLVLTIFALTTQEVKPDTFSKMLTKSALGYVVAVSSGFVIYALVAKKFEQWVSSTPRDSHNLTWTVIQWSSTAFLWWQWLAQDLANIFVFLPRETTVAADGTIDVVFSGGLVIFATLVMISIQAYIFATRGGEIQKIVLSKTNTTDVRAATLVDFIYGLILLFFKELSDIPMSTTWVFLGLLAGRETAIAYVANLRSPKEAIFDVATDAFRALIGLAVSVGLALGLPYLATGEMPAVFG